MSVFNKMSNLHDGAEYSNDFSFVRISITQHYWQLTIFKHLLCTASQNSKKLRMIKFDTCISFFNLFQRSANNGLRTKCSLKEKICSPGVNFLPKNIYNQKEKKKSVVEAYNKTLI